MLTNKIIVSIFLHLLLAYTLEGDDVMRMFVVVNVEIISMVKKYV